MPIYRSDQGRITLQVAGIALDNISWNIFEGGDLSPTMQKYNPGGMQPEVSTGGMRSRSDITLRRAWDDFLIGAYIALDNASGIAQAVASFQSMAADRKTPVGAPIVYTGVLGAVTRPNYDSAASTIQFLQVVISAHEAIS